MLTTPLLLVLSQPCFVERLYDAAYLTGRARPPSQRWCR